MAFVLYLLYLCGIIKKMFSEVLLLIFTQNLETVSYTHLDVYKRQPVVYQFIMRNGETFQYTVKAEFLLSAIPELTITTTDPSIAEIPVSYTHLVYSGRRGAR